jgi:hypothetical protein
MNTPNVYTNVKTALDRMQALAMDEQGMEVVEKVGMIAIMLILLASIGGFFEVGGIPIGAAVVDKLIEFIRSIG